MVTTTAVVLAAVALGWAAEAVVGCWGPAEAVAAPGSGGGGGVLGAGGSGGASGSGGGAHLWSMSFGDMLDDYSASIAVDGAGDVVVTGYFEGSIDVGGGVFTSAGERDLFIAKFDAGGNHLWSKRLGGSARDEGNAITVDGTGNVIVMGMFSGGVDFGGGVLSSAGLFDMFIAKYDAGGNHLWSKRFGGTNYDRSYSVAADTTGNVLLTGVFDGSVDFGGGVFTSVGATDIAIAKLDASGNHLWSKHFGNQGSDVGASIAVDTSGDVLLTGFFSNGVDFGGGVLNSAGSLDLFIAKFDGAGTHLWSKRFGDTYGDYGSSVAVDASDNVLLTGYFDGSVDFGGGVLVSTSRDNFVAKFGADGTHLWSKPFAATSSGVVPSVAVDASGNVLLTGSFDDSIDFGGGVLNDAGSADTFVAKLNAGGAHLWSQRFGNPSQEDGTAIAVDVAGNVLVTGYFQDSVDFGGGPLTSAGFHDIFLLKLAP